MSTTSCQKPRPGATHAGKQVSSHPKGIAAGTAGAKAVRMGLLTIQPGGRAGMTPPDLDALAP